MATKKSTGTFVPVSTGTFAPVSTKESEIQKKAKEFINLTLTPTYTVQKTGQKGTARAVPIAATPATGTAQLIKGVPVTGTGKLAPVFDTVTGTVTTLSQAPLGPAVERATANIKEYNSQATAATPKATTANTTTVTPKVAAPTAQKSGSDYDPYDDIVKVYNAKVAWNNATTDEERKRQNEIANAARATLLAYGYKDVVDQISANGADATAARIVMEKNAPPLSDADLITKNNNEINQKVNQVFGLETSDHSDMTDMYKKEYESIKNTNPFTTAEGQAILAKYDLAGLLGRDNAVASGAASNGGNIDSYAAANAMRQQASLLNQGQMAVLDAHQQKLDNARSILEGLGAYQKDSYSGMRDTIGLQQTEAQRLFQNDETSKNNATDRLYKEADVTGNVPLAWVIKNDAIYSQYLNEDGSFKKEKEGTDIQSLINAAKARGDNDTANKLAAVRSAKINGNMNEFGKYLNQGDLGYIKNRNTADVNQNLAENAIANKEINVTQELGLKKIQAELDGIKMSSELQKSIAELQTQAQKYGYDVELKIAEISKEIASEANETDIKKTELASALSKELAEIESNTALTTAQKEAEVTTMLAGIEAALKEKGYDNTLAQIAAKGEEDRKTLEYANSVGTPFSWTDDSIKKMNGIVDVINKAAYDQYSESGEHYSGKEFKDITPLINKGVGGATWSFNFPNKTTKDSWAWIVIPKIVNNKGITEEEAGAFLSQLGYSQTDINKWA